MINSFKTIKLLIKFIFIFIVVSLLIRMVFTFGNFHSPEIKSFTDFIFMTTSLIAYPFSFVKLIFPIIPNSIKVGAGYVEPLVFIAFIIYLILQIVIDFYIIKLIRKEEIVIELQEKQQNRKRIYYNKDWKD